MSADENVKIEFEISDAHAWELAQLAKRIGFADCRQLSVDDSEAYAMIYAVTVLRQALARAGYAPR